MKVWVICEDRWHPAETIRQGLEKLDRTEFQFTITDRVEDFDPARLKDYPVVLVCRSNSQSKQEKEYWMNESVQQAFEHYVERGGGLLAVHAGTAGYDKEEGQFRRLLGGVFTHHPEACKVTIRPDKQHPIAEGIEEFTVHDEHYFMDWDDPIADLIMTTVSEHGAQPGGWTRTYGRGRAAVLTPGHELGVWTHPMYLRLLRNALYWCAKQAEPGSEN